MSQPSHHVPKIVLTGGPGAGKTTAADMLRREIGPRIVIVPEAATMLFGGGFLRHADPPSRRATQTAIFHVQRATETVFAANYPNRVLLCDRGTVDGAAYWPEPPERFFEAQETTLDHELRRYDHVIFFETAAVGGIDIEGGNPFRVEDVAMAVALDEGLRELWSRHPSFTLIEHHPSFLVKITRALEALGRLVTPQPGQGDTHG